MDSNKWVAPHCCSKLHWVNLGIKVYFTGTQCWQTLIHHQSPNLTLQDNHNMEITQTTQEYTHDCCMVQNDTILVIVKLYFSLKSCEISKSSRNILKYHPTSPNTHAWCAWWYSDLTDKYIILHLDVKPDSLNFWAVASIHNKVLAVVERDALCGCRSSPSYLMKGFLCSFIND